MDYSFGGKKARSLKSFGVAGLLGQDAHVFYNALHSTTQIGKIGDLLSARLQKSGCDEFRLRHSMLISFFQGYRTSISDGETWKRSTEAKLASPIGVECGIDGGAIAIAVSFNVNEQLDIDLEGIEERAKKGETKEGLEELFVNLLSASDSLVFRYAKETRRAELICMMAIPGKLEVGEETPAIQVVPIEGEPEDPPEVKSYTELGDTDYEALLKDDAPGKGKKKKPSMAEMLLKGAQEERDDGIQRIEQGSEEGNALAKAIKGHNFEEDGDNVSVSGSGGVDLGDGGGQKVAGGSSVDEGDDRLKVKGGSGESQEEEGYGSGAGSTEGAEETAAQSLPSVSGDSSEDKSSGADLEVQLYKNKIAGLQKKVAELQAKLKDAGLALDEGDVNLEKLDEEADVTFSGGGLLGTESDSQVVSSTEAEEGSGSDEVRFGADTAEEDDSEEEEEDEEAEDESDGEGAKKKKKGLLKKVWPFKGKGEEEDEEEEDSEYDEEEGDENEDEEGSEYEDEEEEDEEAEEESEEGSEDDALVISSDKKTGEDDKVVVSSKEGTDSDGKEFVQAADDLMGQVEGGKFDKTIRKFEKGADEIKGELKSNRAKKWVDGMMEDLLAEKSRIVDLSKKLSAQARQREMEIKSKELSFKEEMRKKEEVLKQRDNQINRYKDQLNNATSNMERLKETNRGSVNDSQYKKRFTYTQKQLQQTKEEASGLRRKVDELTQKLRVAGHSRSGGADTAETMRMKSEFERSKKQVEAQKKQNSLLMEKLTASQTKVNELHGTSEESKAKMKKAMRLAVMQKEELDKVKQRSTELDRDYVRARKRVVDLEKELQKIQETGEIPKESVLDSSLGGGDDFMKEFAEAAREEGQEQGEDASSSSESEPASPESESEDKKSA